MTSTFLSSSSIAYLVPYDRVRWGYPVDGLCAPKNYPKMNDCAFRFAYFIDNYENFNTNQVGAEDYILVHQFAIVWGYSHRCIWIFEVLVAVRFCSSTVYFCCSSDFSYDNSSLSSCSFLSALSSCSVIDNCL